MGLLCGVTEDACSWVHRRYLINCSWLLYVVSVAVF